MRSSSSLLPPEDIFPQQRKYFQISTRLLDNLQTSMSVAIADNTHSFPLRGKRNVIAYEHRLLSQSRLTSPPAGGESSEDRSGLCGVRSKDQVVACAEVKI